jgi:hypothetical protein
MSEFVLGWQGLMQFKVGGVASGEEWTDLTNVRDVTFTNEATEADATTRAQAGFKALVPSLQTAGVEFEMVWNPEDTGFSAIQDAYQNREAIGLRVLDQAGGQGIEADFAIFNFTRDENLDDTMKVKVSAKLTYSSTPPAWVTGGGG